MNVHKMVADRVIEELKNGKIPWQKPWFAGKEGAYSRSTGRSYTFINQVLLKHTGEYLTFKQCSEAGGSVKKGEKSEIVVFYKLLPKTETNIKGETVTEMIPLLKYYHVFHISQCVDANGEPLKPKYAPENVKPFDSISDAENVALSYLEREGIHIENVFGNRAFYRPLSDSITLPLKEQFEENAEYYSTLFHELVHSTGHKKRLDRLSKDAHFGNTEYSKEELVAEIGAAAILNQLGIETQSSFKNSAAYIQNWIQALQNDTKMITSAAGRAEKATNLILNICEHEELSLNEIVELAS